MNRSLNKHRRPRTAWTRHAIITLVAVSLMAASAQSRVGVAELSPQAERAIDRGLQYLAANQKADGSWGGPGPTALALMAFMVKGYFPDPDRPDRYGVHLDRAVQNLISKSREHGGYFGGNMYHHALATLALAEAWGMSQRDEIRLALKAAVEVTLRAQDRRTGGWRYQPMPVDHDTSVTAMVVVSLAAANEAGILVPGEVMDRAMAYLIERQADDGGFSYRGGNESAFPRSAACVLALQLGGERDSEAVQRGLRYMLEAEPEVAFGQRYFSYAQYYAAQAMYQAGEAPYRVWQPRIEQLLVQSQRDNGSWGGPVDTAMAILVLGVPYRYLPIYQR